MPRRLIYVALAVVVLGLLIYWIARDEGKAEPAEPPRNDTVQRVPPPPAISGPGGAPVAQPSGPRVVKPPGDDSQTQTYVTDTGNVVRDHRPDVKDPVALPAPLPPGERTLDPVIAGAIYQQLAPIVRKCGAEAPTAGRGDDPVAHVTLIADISKGQLTTVEASAVTSDLPAQASEQVVACVRDRASALTVAANGEEDRTGYVLQYPIRLRR